MRKSVLVTLMTLLCAAICFLLWPSDHSQRSGHAPPMVRVQSEASPGRDGGVGGNLLQRDPLIDALGESDNDDCESCQLPFVPFFGTRAGVSCEINYRRGELRDSAYCMSMNPPQHVSMDADGELAICGDNVACLSDPPYDQPTLPFGQSAGAGPFTCRSEATGVTCTVSPSERGFAISPAGIEPVG